MSACAAEAQGVTRGGPENRCSGVDSTGLFVWRERAFDVVVVGESAHLQEISQVTGFGNISNAPRAFCMSQPVSYVS